MSCCKGFFFTTSWCICCCITLWEKCITGSLRSMHHLTVAYIDGTISCSHSLHELGCLDVKHKNFRCFSAIHHFAVFFFGRSLIRTSYIRQYTKATPFTSVSVAQRAPHVETFCVTSTAGEVGCAMCRKYYQQLARRPTTEKCCLISTYDDTSDLESVHIGQQSDGHSQCRPL